MKKIPHRLTAVMVLSGFWELVISVSDLGSINP